MEELLNIFTKKANTAGAVAEVAINSMPVSHSTRLLLRAPLL